MAQSETHDKISSDERYLLDKYNDVLKARAAQVLTLFVTYAIAIRGSESFLDAASVLAIFVPVIAWALDSFVAKPFFQAPYAYELTRLAFSRYSASENDTEHDLDERSLSIGALVVDNMAPAGPKAFELFSSKMTETERRKQFMVWFAKQHAVFGAAFFGLFMLIACVATYSKVDIGEVSEEVSVSESGDG